MPNIFGRCINSYEDRNSNLIGDINMPLQLSKQQKSKLWEILKVLNGADILNKSKQHH